MKIRNGFVSNSSSSSFCIYGVYKGDTDYKENAKKIFMERYKDKEVENFEEFIDKIKKDCSYWKEKIEKTFDKILAKYIDSQDKESFLESIWYDIMIEYGDKEDGLLRWLDLNVGSYGYENDYIGLSFYYMKDEETLRQFKDRIEDALKSLGFSDKCEIVEEAYYEG